MRTLAVVAAVIAVGWAYVIAFLAVATSATCLEAGYPQGKVAWDFSRYCTRRVMQTDVVVPLAVIQQKPLQ
jgi:hypothetical protein